jgi:Fe-S cluster assembly ATP-binding protein
MSLLEIDNLTVRIPVDESGADINKDDEGNFKTILRSFTLEISPGEIHALMGPNGCGKSTLSKVIAGHPLYKIMGGSLRFNGEDLLELAADERAKRGIFLAFQYPLEIPGVTLLNFLRTATNSHRKFRGEAEMPVPEFRKELKRCLELLGMDASFVSRFVNDGFSGGEKKRAEVLQLAMLQPKLAILDETDSGLDIDAMKRVFNGINAIREEFNEKKLTPPAILVITHYNRILHSLRPDFVHLMSQGSIVKSGDFTLAEALERSGYDAIFNETSSLAVS